MDKNILIKGLESCLLRIACSGCPLIEDKDCTDTLYNAIITELNKFKWDDKDNLINALKNHFIIRNCEGCFIDHNSSCGQKLFNEIIAKFNKDEK